MSCYTLLDAHQCSDRTHPFLIHDLLPNMTYQWTFKISNAMGSTCGAGTAYPSRAL